MSDQNSRYFLGIEGGATRTTVLLADESNEVVANFTAGPANLRLMESGELAAHLQAIRQRLKSHPTPSAIGIGLAGARLAADHDRLAQAVAKVWLGVPCSPSDDLITALEAAAPIPGCCHQVLVLSGTGSCCLGRVRTSEAWREVKVGGRGHILGDRASACHIAQLALRAVIAQADRTDEWPALGADILAHLLMNEPESLIDWSLIASKTALAGVAIPVFEAALTRDDPIAVEVLDRAAEMLAEDATSAAERLEATTETKIQFVFNGAVLLKNPEFMEQVGTKLISTFPNAVLSPLDRPSVWGAVALGRHVVAGIGEESSRQSPTAPPPPSTPPVVEPLWQPEFRSPTESRNPRSTNFSDVSIEEGIRIMCEEDRTITDAILAASEDIAWTVRRVVQAFADGGRLFYCGAGTSGRLGVLDASECPPTFRADPEQVQGIIAGGRTALWSAVEGAEDDTAAGQRSIASRGIGAKDIVIGISASGHAPFLWGCLEEAKSRKATTVLLTCHPGYSAHPLPDRIIVADTGPEVLTGSTRLRAGTATKLILNQISTLAMTHSGKVIGNLMVDLNPSNIKLRDRAERIVCELTGREQAEARSALNAAGWIVRDACEALGYRGKA